MTPSDTDSPDDIPAQITAALEDSSDSQLRRIIHYAQRRLRERPPLTNAIESRDGEEIVRMEDHGAYTIVVVERSEETGEARGPFAYRVKREARIEDDGGKYRWHYLGAVHGDTGGD